MLARRLIPLVMLAALLALPGTAGAGVIFQHIGANDPTTHGWLVNLGHGGVSSGPVFNDGGYDAWAVDDNSSVNESIRVYVGIPTAQQNADAAALGWSLAARIRVVDIPDGLDASVVVEYSNGAITYAMLFGAEADGDPMIRLFGGPALTVQNAGPGYHLYEMVFDPVAQSASLLVDGVLHASGYTGFARNLNRMLWGSGQSTSTGQGNYNLVQWSIGPTAVPEPGPLALIAAGLIALHLVRRPRRGRHPG